MDATAATTFITANKGMDILVHLADSSTVFGEALSVNSKGVNVKVNGKTRSIALSKVTDLVIADAEATDFPVELHDGMTTTELAAVFGIEPKELRVHLRALGLGVGKGRKYSLSPVDYRRVNELINA